MGKKLIAAAAIITLVIAGVAAYFLSQTQIFQKPKEVTLTGTVFKSKEETYSVTPTRITFTSYRDGRTYVAAVFGGNSGTYSISLPNEDSYSVSIRWDYDYGKAGGDADAGTLNLDTFEQTIERNWEG